MPGSVGTIHPQGSKHEVRRDIITATAKTAGDYKGKISAGLTALAVPEDAQLATSSLAWARLNSWEVKVSVEDDADTEVYYMFKNLRHTSESPGCFQPNFVTKDGLRKRISETGELTINCWINDNGDDQQPPYRAANPLASLLFDKIGYSDIAFVFSGQGAVPERRIFASKAIISQSCTYFRTAFSAENEASAPTILIDTLEPGNLPAEDEDNAAVHDEDDMGPLDARNSSKSVKGGLEDPNVTVTDETDRGSGSRELNEINMHRETSLPDSSEEAGGSGGEKDSTDAADLREKKRRKIRGTETDQAVTEGMLRRMWRFDIHEESALSKFVAFRAFLSYLHTGSLPFLPLPSDYLVARREALTASGVDPEQFEFLARGEWLREQFYNLPRQLDWKGVKPCSSHAHYRLARKMDCAEVAIIAKERIIRSLTIKNAAYELFSPLSLEYADIENAIFPFFRKNYTAIKSTDAWAKVRAMVYRDELKGDRIFDRILDEVDFQKSN
ncbi:hypothetical protein JCM16303_000574 [Sporobolomyces ruberrimus]